MIATFELVKAKQPRFGYFPVRAKQPEIMKKTLRSTDELKRALLLVGVFRLLAFGAIYSALSLRR